MDWKERESEEINIIFLKKGILEFRNSRLIMMF